MKLTGKELMKKNPKHKNLDENRTYEYTVKGKNSVAKIVPTEHEIAVHNYENEKQKAAKNIQELEVLGMTAEAEAKRQEWQVYHMANNPY